MKKLKIPHLSLLLVLAIFVNHNLYTQVLDYSTVIKIEEGEKIITNKFLIQINSKEKNWLSHVEIGHSPNEEFDLIEAKVLNSKGSTVRKLRNKDLITKSDLSNSAFYQDNLIEEFDLYWNEYPYQIEYSYRITVKEFFYIAWWYPLNYSNVITLKSSLQVDVPLNYDIALDYSDEIHHEEFTVEERKIHKWSFGQFKFPKTETFAPPIRALIPYVSIMPLKFDYGVNGTAESWSSFGAWQYELNRGTDQLPMSEKTVIDELIAGMQDKRQIVKTLYQYLQDKTKYVNVDIGVGGLKSYSAFYVSRNKYGDCKALTTYMKALLAYVGIESSYTLVNSGENAGQINKDFPSQQFNHVILAVPFKNDTIWLENTSNSLPFNYLGTFTQDRYALAVNGVTSSLIKTPKLKASDVFEKQNYYFDQDKDGIWQASISKTLRGKSFESYRHYKSQASLKDQKEKVLRDIAIDDFEPNSWEIFDGKREDQKIDISLSGNCGSQIREIGNFKVLDPLRLKIPDFEEPNRRTLSVKINYPINQADSIVYNLPLLKNYTAQLPENINLKSVYGTYQTTYLQINNTIVVCENFQINQGNYPIKEYPSFYSFINSINNYRKTSSIILR